MAKDRLWYCFCDVYRTLSYFIVLLYQFHSCLSLRGACSVGIDSSRNLRGHAHNSKRGEVQMFQTDKGSSVFHALEIAHKHFAMFLIASETRCEGNRTADQISQATKQLPKMTFFLSKHK